MPIKSAGTQDNPFTWTVSYEMNHREPPHLPVGMRRALYCLSLLMLPAMSPGGAQALTRPRPTPDGPERGVDRPYLPALGAVPLRFQEAAPPPDLVTRPAAAAPPTPALSPTETSVALANAAAAARPATPSPREPAPAATSPATVAPSNSAPAKTPPAILPDDASPSVKPEDFLPYFQLPGSAKTPGDVTVIVPAPRSAPAPAAIPPSSASYTQSPR